jgi:hypothetical protein
MSADDYFKTICVANTYYNAAAVLNDPANLIYEFIPSPTNICNGNYPPGYMELASPYLITAIDEIVNSTEDIGGASCFVLRDMGKTIYAPISDNSFGYFRMVQLVCPQPIPYLNIYNNQLGGPGGSKYGIFGGVAIPDDYTNYTTFYIPVVVGGVAVPNTASTYARILAGGQM